jgi:hypothetical protein
MHRADVDDSRPAAVVIPKGNHDGRGHGAGRQEQQQDPRSKDEPA